MRQILTREEYRQRIIDTVVNFFQSRGLDKVLDGVYRKIFLDTIMEYAMKENYMFEDEYRELYITIFETDENGDDWSDDFTDEEIQELMDRKEFKDKFGHYANAEELKDDLFDDINVHDGYSNLLNEMYIQDLENEQYMIQRKIYAILWGLE